MKQSHAACLVIEELPKQLREASALNGNIVSDSENDNPLSSERAKDLINKGKRSQLFVIGIEGSVLRYQKRIYAS